MQSDESTDLRAAVPHELTVTSVKVRHQTLGLSQAGHPVVVAPGGWVIAVDTWDGKRRDLGKCTAVPYG